MKMSQKKVFCFGELLLRMSPELNGKWINDASIPFYIGGAELNVATALAKWDVPVKYCTAIPDNYLTAEILKELSQKNIDVSSVLLGGERLGMYFLPQGLDLKNAGVIYDRANSSFWNIKPGMLNWDNLLADCNWLHLSAVSPALNPDSAAVCAEAISAARQNNMVVSIDLNYRSKLWQYGTPPPAIMVPMVEQCDVVMGNIWSAQQLLGIDTPVQESKGLSKEELVTAAEVSMQLLQQRFPRVKHIAYTFRLEEEYFGVLHHEGITNISSSYPLEDVVDKVGSGDCFMAALIYGIVNHSSADDIVNRAALAAVGKMKEKGDATQQRMTDIEQKMKSL
jgi:2-dehydro-3-deoxygluconokinase